LLADSERGQIDRHDPILPKRQAIDKLEFRAEQTIVVLLLLVASCSSVANTLICS
jgi:hypothetical protein